MKIYRTELLSDIDRKLFEIDVDQLGLENVKFSKNKINGYWTVDRMSSGFHIKGKLNIPYKLSCDRCLTIFNDVKSIDFDFILTDDDQLNHDDSDDVIFFPISENEYDLNPLFQELIQLELEMKILCSPNCKGLCTNCGTNLNTQECDCNKEQILSTWDALKKIKGNNPKELEL